MGDWRHFGERLDPGPIAGGCGAMGDGLSAYGDGPRVRHQAIPRPSSDDKAVPDALARLVEAEILPRLMMAHRPVGRRAQSDRAPSPEERAALDDLSASLSEHDGSTDPEGLQAVVYEVGRRHFPDLSGKGKSPDGRPGVSQAWFTTIYNVLFGEARGPRFGSFVALYGVAETRALIAKALSGELLAEHAAFTASRAAKSA